MYVSLHGTPDIFFPWIKGFSNEVGEGEGKEFNLNIPLKPETEIEEYISNLNIGLDKIKDYSPDYLLVSLGLDIVEGDNQGGLNIKTDDYIKIGNKIKKLIDDLKIPLMIVQEGGYSGENNAKAVIKLFEGMNIEK